MDVRFVWLDGVDSAEGRLWLSGRPAEVRLRAARVERGWAAWADWPHAQHGPVAGPYPDRLGAKAAAETYVREAVRRLAEVLARGAA